MSSRRRRFLAAIAGAVTVASLPPWGWWPLGVLGIAAFVHLPAEASGRARFATAWWFWIGAYLPGMVWMIDLTLPGWLVATPIEAAIMAAPLALLPPTGVRRLAGLPAALVVGEAVRWVVPFGGVPMTNLALGQVGAPWVDVVRVGGPLLLVAVIGLAAVAVAGARAHRGTALIALGALILLTAVATAAPRGVVERQLEVAVVQAGGALGTNAVTNTERPVFDRHVAALAASPPDVELIVWSESSASSFGPVETSLHMTELEDLARTYGATIIANFSEMTTDRFRNTAVSVDPERGYLDRYDKVHLVPFGEYVPLRGFIERFVDLSLIPREAIPGTGSGVLDTGLGPVATVISFEVYFPERVRSGVADGGRIVVNPTLASSYTTSMVPGQSLASARLRAIESGRWVLQSSTTGFSAIVDPDGRVVARTGLREAGVVTAVAELRSGSTWATQLGKWPVTLMALLLLGWVAAPRPRRVRSDPTP